MWSVALVAVRSTFLIAPLYRSIAAAHLLRFATPHIAKQEKTFPIRINSFLRIDDSSANSKRKERLIEPKIFFHCEIISLCQSLCYVRK